MPLEIHRTRACEFTRVWAANASSASNLASLQQQQHATWSVPDASAVSVARGSLQLQNTTLRISIPLKSNTTLHRLSLRTQLAQVDTSYRPFKSGQVLFNNSALLLLQNAPTMLKAQLNGRTMAIKSPHQAAASNEILLGSSSAVAVKLPCVKLVWHDEWLRWYVDGVMLLEEFTLEGREDDKVLVELSVKEATLTVERIELSSANASDPYCAPQVLIRAWLLQNLVYTIDILTSDYSNGDLAALELLTSRQLWFILVVNPDGYAHNEMARVWEHNKMGQRKSGAPTCDRSPPDAGVDLNRNYDACFARDSKGSSNDPCGDDYNGPRAFSEPETQAVRSIVERNTSDFSVALNYHSYGKYFNLPFACQAEGQPTEPNNSMFMALAREMAHFNGFNYGQSWKDSNLYTVNGETSDWMWQAHGIFAMSPEVGPGFEVASVPGFWPSADDVPQLSSELHYSNVYLARMAGPVYALEVKSVQLGTIDDGGSTASFVSVEVVVSNSGLRPGSAELLGSLFVNGTSASDPVHLELNAEPEGSGEQSHTLMIPYTGDDFHQSMREIKDLYVIVRDSLSCHLFRVGTCKAISGLVLKTNVHLFCCVSVAVHFHTAVEQTNHPSFQTWTALPLPRCGTCELFGASVHADEGENAINTSPICLAIKDVAVLKALHTRDVGSVISGIEENAGSRSTKPASADVSSSASSALADVTSDQRASSILPSSVSWSGPVAMASLAGLVLLVVVVLFFRRRRRGNKAKSTRAKSAAGVQKRRSNVQYSRISESAANSPAGDNEDETDLVDAECGERGFSSDEEEAVVMSKDRLQPPRRTPRTLSQDIVYPRTMRSASHYVALLLTALSVSSSSAYSSDACQSLLTGSYPGAVAAYPKLKDQIELVAKQQVAQWYTDRVADVSTLAKSVVLPKCDVESASPPTVIVYGLPQKDCAHGFSTGGSNANTNDYRVFLQQLAASAGDRQIVYILEPDAVGLLADNGCGNDKGYAANLGQAAAVAQIVNAVDPDSRCKGISLNTSNYRSNAEMIATCERFVKASGRDYKCIVDTSRNFVSGSSEWCNSEWAGIGEFPTSHTGSSVVSRYIWAKPPGESDGECTGQSNEALRGPSAGTFFPDHFVKLWDNGVFVQKLGMAPINAANNSTVATPAPTSVQPSATPSSTSTDQVAQDIDLSELDVNDDTLASCMPATNGKIAMKTWSLKLQQPQTNDVDSGIGGSRTPSPYGRGGRGSRRRVHVEPVKPERYRSKFDPTVQPTGTTFGVRGKTKLEGANLGTAQKIEKPASARGFGRLPAKPDPKSFTRKGERSATTVVSKKRDTRQERTSAVQDQGRLWPVPRYLSQVKDEIERENSMIEEFVRQNHNLMEEDGRDRVEPMDESERLALVDALKSKWDHVNAKYQKLCHNVVFDTLGKVRRKETFEKELTQLEKDIQLLEKGRVVVSQNNGRYGY
ncbi:Enkurin domain [Phytophthora cactorum]|nr:Enkurin domain [Phytophthora cactorum]